MLIAYENKLSNSMGGQASGLHVSKQENEDPDLHVSNDEPLDKKSMIS